MPKKSQVIKKEGGGMTDFRFKQTGGIGLLDFYGELTVQDAEKLRQGFIASFERSDYVVVNLKNVSSLDTSCFGLFCSAYRIFIRCNKRLFLTGLGPKIFRVKEVEGRPERPFHCVSECRDGCLWNG